MPVETKNKLAAIIADLHHVLPDQAPIKDFVHHNTLHGYQHLNFQEALSQAKVKSGASGYLPLEQFREHYRVGRVTKDDLLWALQSEADPDLENIIYTDDGFTLRRSDVFMAALLHPLRPVTGCQLNWLIDEHQVLHKFQSDVSEETRQILLRRAENDRKHTAIADLWQACLKNLNLNHFIQHPEDLIDLTTEHLESLQGAAADVQTSTRNNLKRIIQKESTNRLKTLLDSVGTEITLHGLLSILTGQDVVNEIRPYLVRQFAAFLDEGVASWTMASRDQGFYCAWRYHAAHAPTWIGTDRRQWRDHIDSLPEDALETIIAEFRRLDLPESRWESYLQQLSLEMPGWSGMFNWREQHPDYSDATQPVSLTDYLAVRMTVERLSAQVRCAEIWNIEPGLKTLRWYFRQNPAELVVRHSLYNLHLPEYLIALAQRLVNSDQGSVQVEDWWRVAELMWVWQQNPLTNRLKNISVYGSAWPLFRLSQHLGLSANEVSSMTISHFQTILDCLSVLDTERMSFIWLKAYEHNYRDKVYSTLVKNHGRGRWQSRPYRPDAQIVFCMDDREESFRRHLEEINPKIETLGAAGFFGLAINWLGLNDTRKSPLCPVVVQPSHDIQERARIDHVEHNIEHQRRRSLGLSVRNMLIQEGARNPLLSLGLNILAAPLALPGLALKLFAPLVHSNIRDRYLQRLDIAVVTEITTEAITESTPASPAHPRLGFSDKEQVNRVKAFLRNIGLQSGHGQLVVLMGHGSSSTNNPHLAAYDCGACSGRHGGPNARAFAKIVNRPKVRTLLAQDGLIIPEDTWFIGAEHNTGNEDIIWYDIDVIPDNLTNVFSRLQTELDEAKLASAHERCRRLASAPDNPAPIQALRHVQARGQDISQSRPELGHATNAFAIIGRRSVSRGSFLDRRAFLISYDACQDNDNGNILENILLAVGPVGAGINLEYYFSTVNNDQYGCGSKVTHNITGLLGVMEGTSSDLKTGLPQQMVEIHEAMRLQVLVESSTAVLDSIYDRQPALQELIGNGWLLLSAIDPESGRISVLDIKHGWSIWTDTSAAYEPRENSVACYLGQRDALPPTLIATPVDTHV